MARQGRSSPEQHEEDDGCYREQKEQGQETQINELAALSRSGWATHGFSSLEKKKAVGCRETSATAE